MHFPDLDDRALAARLSGVPSYQYGLDWLVPLVKDVDQASSMPVPVKRPAPALLLAHGFSIERGCR